jgi:hypothetical protein
MPLKVSVLCFVFSTFCHAADLNCMLPFSTKHPMHKALKDKARFIVDGYVPPVPATHSIAIKLQNTQPEIALNYLAAFLGYIPTRDGFMRNHHVRHTHIDYIPGSQVAGLAYISTVIALENKPKLQAHFRERLRDLAITAGTDLLEDAYSATGDDPENAIDPVNFFHQLMQVHKLCHWLKLHKLKKSLYKVIATYSYYGTPIETYMQLLMTYYLSADAHALMDIAEEAFNQIQYYAPTIEQKADLIFQDDTQIADLYELILTSYALAKTLTIDKDTTKSINDLLSKLHGHFTQMTKPRPDLLQEGVFLRFALQSLYYQGRFLDFRTLYTEPSYEEAFHMPALAFRFALPSKPEITERLAFYLQKLGSLDTIVPEHMMQIEPLLYAQRFAHLRKPWIDHLASVRTSADAYPRESLNAILSALSLIKIYEPGEQPLQHTYELLTAVLRYPLQREQRPIDPDELSFDDFERFVLPIIRKFYTRQDRIIEAWMEHLKSAHNTWWNMYLTEVSGVNAKDTSFREPAFLNRFARDGWFDPGIMLGLRFEDQVRFIYRRVSSKTHAQGQSSASNDPWSNFQDHSRQRQRDLIQSKMRELRRRSRGENANDPLMLSLHWQEYWRLAMVLLKYRNDQP